MVSISNINIIVITNKMVIIDANKMAKKRKNKKACANIAVIANTNVMFKKKTDINIVINASNANLMAKKKV